MRGGVDIGDDDANAEGVLGQTAVAAGLDDRGRVIEKLQKEVTKQREDFAHEQLAAAMAALPRGDAVRLAFEQWDRYGSQFIDALPNKRHLLCARDWREAWFHFLSVPNPAYAHHVGRQIVAGKPARFDEHGWELVCAIMRADGWKRIHDRNMHLLYALAMEVGYDMPMEREDLFLSEMAVAALDAFRSRSLRERRALIPDFLLRHLNPEGLGDVKCMRPTRAFRRATVPGQPMKARQAKVQYEYDVKLDRQ